MSNSPGLWICIDGPDFTGKGTQTTELFKRLIMANEDNVVTYTHEPTRNAKAIKAKLKAEVGNAYGDPELMAKLYIQDRVDNERNVIRPALTAGGIVISNRHKYSTLAYQASQGVPIDELVTLHKEKRIGTPDITFFLFVGDHEELCERMARTGKTGDKFESDLAFQKLVAANYKRLVKIAKNDPEFYGNIYPIQKERPRSRIEDVADSIWQNLEPVYKAWTERRDRIQ